MSKALVTMGSKTTHGGIVTECENSFVINGIAVHLNGMKHFVQSVEWWFLRLQQIRVQRSWDVLW